MSGVRGPGLSVSLNGALASGVVSAEIISVSYCAADQFSVGLAIPDLSLSPLAMQPSVLVNVAVVDGDASASLIRGMVDCYRYDFVRKIMWLEGRDLTAVFLEEQVSESFVNQTSSDIATLLASRHGLGANVSPTATLIGRYYEADHSRLMMDQFSQANTEWDLLVWLAHMESFDVWVTENTLNFQPRSLASSPSHFLVPQNCIDLELERAMSFARDIQVSVKSWNSFSQSSLTQVASSAGSIGNAKNYVVVRPNLSADQAGRIAQSLVDDISAHERVLNATIVGEATMSPRDVIQLAGTGTSFDQNYQIVRLVRRLDHTGFVQQITAMAASPA